jgi:hypothetical protein
VTATTPGALWSQRATTRLVVYLNGVATDITSFVLQPPAGGRITAGRGRQTELAGMDPSLLTFTLLNTDRRFTPHNAASPYYPYWRMGARVVWTETLGHITFTHFDGYLELPRMSTTFDTGDTSYSVVTVSAVDTLTQLARTDPFPSNLAPYIETDPALVCYFPLLEPDPPFVDRITGAALWPTVTTLTGLTAMVDTLFPADQEGPLGEDPGVSFLRSTPILTGAGSVAYSNLRTGLAVTVTDTLALSCWARTDVSGSAVEPVGTLVNLHNAAGATAQFAQITNDAVNLWTRATADYDFPAGSDGTAQATKPLPPEVWTLVTMRLSLPAGDIELWVGRDVVATATMSGTPPTSMEFDTILVTDNLYGSIGHVQVRLGDDVMPYTQHLEQHQLGLDGLARQRTGERIRTVLGYAGVPTSAMDRVDDGTSVMRRASLAGKTARQAIDEAVDTERGRLFSAGTGEVVFHDRRRVYDA